VRVKITVLGRKDWLLENFRDDDDEDDDENE